MIDKSHWPRVGFGDVVRQVKDKVDPKSSGLKRYIAGEHMDTDDLRIRRWGEIGDDYLGPAFHMRFNPGQVLYGSRRTYLRKVAVPDFEGITANTTFVLEPKDPNVLLPELLPFIMQTESFNDHSVKQSKGSVNPYVNFSDLAWYEFALPPLEEQRRIAEVLGSSDIVTNSLEECLTAAESLRSAVRAEEFNPERHAPRLLAELCSDGAGIQIGPFGAQLHQSDYLADGIPVIMPMDMVNNQVSTERISRVSLAKAEELSIHRVEADDILLPRRGELNRRAYIESHNAGWLCGTGSLRIRVDNGIPPRAVFHALASVHAVRWLKGNAVGTTMPNLNSSIVSRLPVAMPPGGRLEQVLAGLDELDAQIGSIAERLARASQIKTNLLSQALRVR